MEAGKIEFFGSLADLETRGVQNVMVKIENQDHGRRTASERWKLFKLVSRIGHQLYRNWPTNESHKKVIFTKFYSNTDSSKRDWRMHIEMKCTEYKQISILFFIIHNS